VIIFKLDRPLIFFDLETTGLDTNKDRIIELAAVKISPSSKKPWMDPSHEKIEMLFNPGIPIPKSATDIHGIDDEDVKDCPPLNAAAMWAFFSGCDLAGYNIRRFDVPMLLAELERHGHPLSLDGVRIIDACDIFHKREPRTLEGAMLFYCHKEHDEAHIAMGDVTATMRVLGAQLERYTDLPRETGALHEVFVDKDAVDLAGKLRWVDDHVTINFGKHKGMPLRLADRNYLLWMRDAQVIGSDAAHVIEDALKGEFPRRTR
jgi:DNA polymerase-3 subunit epsilon